MGKLYNETAEKNIIGAVITEPETIKTVRKTGIKSNDFYTELKIVYSLMLDIENDKEKIDIVQLQERAKKNRIDIDISYIIEAVTESYSIDTSTIETNCKTVKELSKKRQISEMLKDVRDNLLSEDLASITSQLKDVTAVTQINNEVEKSLLTASQINDGYKTKTIICTGFDVLDAGLGGFIGGTLNIISGESGTGKSTLVNQIIVNAISEGNKVMLYSGELTNSNAINWIYRTLANDEDITETKDNKTGAKVYRLTDASKWQMKQWLNNKLYIHSDKTEATLERLLIEIEHMSEARGVKLFVIDNLMSINADKSGSEIYDRQRSIVYKLKEIAKRLDIAIVLVAHNKKESSGNKYANQFDISGASEVANYSDTITIIRRSAEEATASDTDANKTYLNIVKNRNTGKLVQLYGITFDRKRKRFYELFPEELKKNYGYSKNICEENQVKIGG